MTYADIILPLPLDSLFTYSVPDSLAGRVGQGVRVLVPFGKSKTYVGLVVRTHNNKPDFKVKDISVVMDDAPVVNSVQLELWRWMADYYLSSVGDVMNAALPSGLKSEDGYTAKTETYVSLAPEYRNERAIHVALDMLKRAEAQRKVFETFLTLSHWDTISGDLCAESVAEVSRDELMNESHGTSAAFRNLVVRKFLNTYEREIGRLNHGGEPHPELIKPLNEAQQTAYNNIVFSFLKKDVVLLHGVTSSGKTEIYIHLISQAIERHQQVLYLLPEIALTVQIRQRLQRVFGNRLGIYHSKYSDAERVEIWKKQLSATPYDVILGARSAVLLPFTNLGLVIIDEEHETSFKQQDPAPRYHARSVAIMLARKYGAKVLLGSATPSLESWNNAHTGKFGLVSLTHRYNDIQLPEIEVVDIKDLQHRRMMNGPFSPRLMAAVRTALDNGEQAILFQNRRGFAPMIECRECGWVPHCDKCDVSLTYHKSLGQLTCHYCGATYTVPDVCPCCGSRDLRGRGYGTEKVEDKVMELFPDARVARMDLDTTRTRNAYERLISEFSAHKTDILIGTQMVSKGLDFDKVSVVGILNADSMLNYPDFRAYEHAFMMMAQVAGRAGRKGKRGLVILQTKSPQLPVIAQVVRNDCENFFADLIEERRTFNYPPFCHLIYVFLKHRDDFMVASASMRLSDILRGWFGARVLGPDKPSVAKVKTLNIRKIMLKLENGIDLAKVRLYLRKAQAMMEQDKKYRSVQIYFDVDPL
ncbi:primosomal protein N' [uncultured Prevotella sp.]|uniref:replication restart helicase PriA n=1 Tax=uncultured Prevotella sp. TaxID=159272 RepID=UPI0025E3B279|nr:primosomal protein N' [uncultured Prevotella sp.]